MSNRWRRSENRFRFTGLIFFWFARLTSGRIEIMKPVNSSGKQRLAIHSVLLLGLVLVLSSCVTFHNRTIDETDNSAWWGQYAKGEVIRLKQDALLDGIGITRNAVRATGANGMQENISVGKFKSESDEYSNVPDLHLLTEGTRLRCVKLERFYTFETQHYVVHVEILDGEFSSRKAILNGRFVSGDPDKKGDLRLSANLFETVK